MIVIIQKDYTSVSKLVTVYTTNTINEFISDSTA